MNYKKQSLLFLFFIIYSINLFAAPKKTTALKSIVDNFGELASKILQTNEDGKKASYAFVALSSDDGNAIAEDYVTDALTEAAFNTGKIKIFERANLEKILSEQKFQASGLVDEDTAKDIGKIAGVDYICYGTLKNVGDNITVNIRVVDVQNGEICAMSRATVEKDTYLRNVKYEARKQNNVEKTTNSNVASDRSEVKSKSNKSSWETSVVRNDFDEETIYTFKCMNPDGSFILFGYEKADKSINSRVRCSLPYKPFHHLKDMDFKLDSGDIVKIKNSNSSTMFWDYNGGINYSSRSNSYEYLYYADVTASKQLFNMLITNKVIYIRDEGDVNPYETDGLEEVMALNGITVDEIYKAFGNESF